MIRPIILSSRVLLGLSVLTISFLATSEIDPSSQSLINDKLLHCLCFGYLTIICKMANFIDQDFWLYVIVLCYGILIEIVQMFLPYRSFEFLDILADFIGILCAGFLLKHAKDLNTSY
jgi:VanZ family protein